MENISGLVSTIGNFVRHRDKGTDKGTDSTFDTEIGQNGCFITHQTNDLLWAFPNTYSTSRAFEYIYMWYHKLLLCS